MYKYDQAIYIGNSQFNKMNSIATILILGTFSVSTLAQSLRNNSHPNIHLCPTDIDDIDRVSKFSKQFRKLPIQSQILSFLSRHFLIQNIAQNIGIATME